MSIDWRLREVMASQGIANAPQLQAALREILGIQISREALDKLLKKAPVQLRLETAQYLCTLFHVPLNDILVIHPEPVIRQPVLIKPFAAKANPSASLMVDPGDFF